MIPASPRGIYAGRGPGRAGTDSGGCLGAASAAATRPSCSSMGSCRRVILCDLYDWSSWGLPTDPTPTRLSHHDALTARLPA